MTTKPVTALSLLLTASLLFPVASHAADDRADATLLSTALRQPLSTTQTASTANPAWMSPDVADAWQQGYKGQNVTLSIVDDFWGWDRIDGSLGGPMQSLSHGMWVASIAYKLAPLARLETYDVRQRWLFLQPGLNVINMSYDQYSTTSPDTFVITPRDKSLVSYAHSGSAVVVKAAGNMAMAVGQPTWKGEWDQLSVALKGARSAIYVGALDKNGSASNRSDLAWYSNRPGNDKTIQNQFLVVGTAGNLSGTSFAAPVVAGYAAIIGSKFTTASPAAITRQLLDTARQDTLINYSPEKYGRGEASLSRALAPVAIR